jgi:predicted SprT family Zn-dependent metalloprotease
LKRKEGVNLAGFYTTHKQSFFKQKKQKRMLKTIAGLQGVTVLSKDAQKKIGGLQRYSCHCIGSVGEWTANYPRDTAFIKAEIIESCSSGRGICNKVR